MLVANAGFQNDNYDFTVNFLQKFTQCFLKQPTVFKYQNFHLYQLARVIHAGDCCTLA